MNSTIFALSSAPGRAGVAVVRVSGPLAGPALTGLAGPLPAPRQAVLRRLAFDGAQIDRALVLWFAGPVSFTGEDLAELHIHGGRAVREAVFSALLQHRSCAPPSRGSSAAGRWKTASWT
jgi:tRNA modification GTPase